MTRKRTEGITPEQPRSSEKFGKVTVKYKDLFTALGKATAQTLIAIKSGGTVGVIDVVKNLKEIPATVSSNKTHGHLAWELIKNALTGTLADLIDEQLRGNGAQLIFAALSRQAGSG